MPRKNHSPQLSRTPFRITQCGSKRKFPTEQAASSQAELQMLEQPQLTLAVYQCDFCHKWHLTSRKSDHPN